MAPLKKQKTSAVADTIPVASTSTRVTRSKSNLIPKTGTAATSEIVEVDKSVKSSKAVPKKTTQPAKAKSTKADGSKQPVITGAAEAESSLVGTKEATNSTSTSKKTAATAKKVAVDKNSKKKETKEKVDKPDTKVVPKSILKKTQSIPKVKPSSTKDVEEEEKDDEKGENSTSNDKEEAFTKLSKTQELLQTAFLGIDSSEGEYSSGEERVEDDDDDDGDNDNVDDDNVDDDNDDDELEKHFSLRLTDEKEEVLRVKTKNLPATEDRGVVYLGRIPHGFYENEMKDYFSQFGKVTRLRLSRNKRTGKSKHFAFIEFENAQVAEVVAETMDNYLLYNHILKCKVVPKEKQHPDLFTGAGRKFVVMPWKKIERARHNKQKNQVQILRQQKRLLFSESKKRKRLDKLGIDYNFKGYRAEAVPTPKHQRYER